MKKLACYLIVGVAAISTCLAVDPADKLKADEAYKAAYRVFKQTRNLEQTEELNNKVLAIDPDHLNALLLKGAVETERRDFAAARATFEKAEKSHPNEPKPRFNLAELDFAEHRWAEAEKAFTTLLDSPLDNDKTKPIVRFKVMVAALKQGDRKTFDTHLAVFKKEGRPMPIEFSELLLEIDTEKPPLEKARGLWENLWKKHEGSSPYPDSIIEAYYQELFQKR